MSTQVPADENELDAHQLLQLLADDLTWQLLPALSAGDAQLHELQAVIGAPIDALEDRLAQLRKYGIVDSRLSDADGTTCYYRLRVDRLRSAVQRLVGAIHPAFQLAELPDVAPAGPGRPRVLFLCTENSARSQLAEALLRRLSKGAVEACSAGTKPGAVHPQVLELLGAESEGLRSKHVDTLAGQHFDYVVTVCDKARETCPSFAGAEQQAHWSIADPAAVAGAEAQRRAFTATITELAQRIRYLLIFIERGRRAAQPEVHS